MDPEQAEAHFQQARRDWQAAVGAHAMAPPDGAFSARIAALAAAAAKRARSCEEAYEAGFEWPAAPASAEPPYELRPGSGRRGPPALWHRFDRTVTELGRASEGRSMRAVGRAYADLAEIAGELAKAVEREDRASGLLPPTAKSVAA
jgi:hypothetical protein